MNYIIETIIFKRIKKMTWRQRISIAVCYVAWTAILIYSSQKTLTRLEEIILAALSVALIIILIYSLLKKVAVPTSPSGLMPSLPSHFLPRSEDVKAVKDILLADVKKSVGITGKRVGVYGMGGIGKTVLAVAVARDEEVQNAFKDGVIWLTIGQDPDIISKQRELADALKSADLTFIQHLTTLMKMCLGP